MQSMERMTLDGVIQLLEQACRKTGSASAFAVQHKVSPAYLSDIIARNRMPGPKVLRALGLRKVVLYEREK